MFIRSNKLEQLKLKLEKIIGILKNAGKVRKGCLFWKLQACKTDNFIIGKMDKKAHEHFWAYWARPNIFTIDPVLN